ncbi:citrate synthase [Parenemella sanctibonifatiensis]|uniref:Citrate synthase n=1 Tax=Parenemella sanctibonifatiensis TaxID=2016505 RepID=A0A255EIY7_9ACTN|nr:citrate synthase [Parenemella sanctibonifatiensis]OYN89392.1 citrate (Si)-synthase [Parenemella sanctibonifatiensis]
MAQQARLEIEGTTYELPIITGTEDESAFDISKLRSESGYITLDSGYGNTGSCTSEITFINGEAGILQIRGIPIEQLAEHSDFVETAYLVIFGELPTVEQRERFDRLIGENSKLDESTLAQIQAFPADAHPMAVLAAILNVLFVHEENTTIEPGNREQLEEHSAKLLGKTRTIAAAFYRASKGEKPIQPSTDKGYVAEFFHEMFSTDTEDHEATAEADKALNFFLLLHADHEQNCSTSTVRMVASSHANLYTSVAAGVSALWGPRHGGANMEVVRMLEKIQADGDSLDDVVAKVKDKTMLLQGFGHRVYRNFDPRAKVLGGTVDALLEQLNVEDPLLQIARDLEQVALADEYFVERKLYPNVDFYSGIVLRALGIPLEMYTVMFALGRMPGWIANWAEVNDDPKIRIYRPRQIYTGATKRDWVAPADR